MAIQHYDGELGYFDYDDTEFVLHWSCLYYIGHESDGSRIKIPDGLVAGRSLFYDNTTLVTPPVIPKSVRTCKGMFSGCSHLEIAPKLSDNISDCNTMFIGCHNLQYPPELPKHLKGAESMFANCFSMKTPPVVPPSVVVTSQMFDYCSRAVTIAGEWNLRHRGQQWMDKYYERNEEFLKQYYPDDICQSFKKDASLLYDAYSVAVLYSQGDSGKIYKHIVDGISCGVLATDDDIHHECDIVEQFNRRKNHISSKKIFSSEMYQMIRATSDEYGLGE